MDSIKGLLDGMLRRHQITAQVTTARIIEVSNEALAQLLPPGRSADATAVSVREGTVLVHCRNAAAAEFVGGHAENILDAVKGKLPSARVDRIRTRIGV